MRDFVQNHTAYKQDSVVPDEITYDMLKKVSVDFASKKRQKKN